MKVAAAIIALDRWALDAFFARLRVHARRPWQAEFRDFASLGGRKALKVHLFAQLLELKANADAGL